MASNIFTPEFYKAFYDAVIEEGKADSNYADICDGEHVSIDFYIGEDDMYVTCEAHYITELHDDSFDHAFGTWHDPYPYLEVVGCDDIYDVKVYESDCKDAKEIEGFDYDSFWAQFEVESYAGFKKGDKVSYSGKEVEFLAYNTETGEYKIRRMDGLVLNVLSRFIRRIRKT